MYPIDDVQYEDVAIAKVTATESGWEIKRQDGWSFYVLADSPVKPIPYMRARFYGKGIGYTVRGLFLSDQKVFYRTEIEQKEKDLIDWYGANAREWLKRWDNGQSVWSISMGGFGPGYEQCIQIMAAEIIRVLLSGEFTYEDWKDLVKWEADRTKIDKSLFANKTINALGLSGAQHGAALNLAI